MIRAIGSHGKGQDAISMFENMLRYLTSGQMRGQ